VNPLNPLYIAVAWVMTHIHSGLSLFMPSTSGQAWFLTIVVLVVLMRLILVPLFIKQMHSMRKMSALTPQLQELRKKYKGDKQTLNEETMRLYKEAGVNPLGGCLPLLAQMPIFFALFSVLRAIAGWHEGLPSPYGMPISVVKSAQQANILGAHISDKVLFTGTMHVPLEAKIVILCAVAISVATTFMTVRQSTKRGMTPQMTPDNPMAASQKYMAYIVPFFALSGLYWAFGLVLYWVTTNVWTLGQQYVLFKRYPPTEATATAGTASSPGVSTKPATAKPGTAKPGTAKPATGTARPAGTKPATNARPAAGAKPAPGTKPAAGARSAQAKSSASSGQKSSASSGQQRKKAPGSAAAASGTAQRKPQQARSAEQETSGNGSGAVSGILRRFSKGGRTETEEQPQEPDVKLVRQQRVRQSRSKRSGKR